MRTENTELRTLFRKHGFITDSESMMPVLRLARRAAVVSDITILIEGETGTGKQVLARTIHALDEKRSAFPFVTVHCSTITETLAESELFGHQRGAFSGATGNRAGLFHTANRGTLFLDDVNDLPLALQPKLLDVLQRGIIRPVGSDRELPIDVRIISAANQPLAPLVARERFRNDLYHRLNVAKLCLPPLHERGEDLETLMLAFAARNRNLYPEILQIDAELIRFLRLCPLRGNVRELEHAVTRMLFLKTEGTSLGMADWLAQAPASTADGHADLVGEAAQKLWTAVFEQGVPWSEAIERLETRLLERVLMVEGQTRRDIAKRLNTSERTLYHKLRHHKLARLAAS
jgi:transcriptional regulator with PAS, ATPase and Fis domain